MGSTNSYGNSTSNKYIRSDDTALTVINASTTAYSTATAHATKQLQPGISNRMHSTTAAGPGLWRYPLPSLPGFGPGPAPVRW